MTVRATSGTLSRMEEPELTAMPAGFTPVVPFDECWDAQYGLEVVSDDVEGEGLVRGRVPVRDVLLTDQGVVHGGVFTSAAEALASRGTAMSVIPKGFMAMGLSNDTSILELVSDGVIHVEARVVSRAEDAWVWTVDARDEVGRACALSRVTVAVRPLTGVPLS
jgi:1,4-dihydroxy-2-naphthoyl-CoA hydrolase